MNCYSFLTLISFRELIYFTTLTFLVYNNPAPARDMEVAQILCMNKGGGETSYAKNSSLQTKIISDSKRITKEAIENIISMSVLSLPQSISIADLGCSSGPNALLVVSEILHLLYSKCKRLEHPFPEVTVFLNDLFSNDFNYIFGSLPAFYQNINSNNSDDVRPCFITGVPGSFYGRLFQRNSLHFIHSSSSLHWLSKVPAGLDKNCINKGKVYISETSPHSVVEAYAMQFRNDFSTFIKARSEELVNGGRMVLSFMGRKSMDPTTADSCYQWELLAQALMRLVSQGMVEDEKVDSFNAPYYAPCREELKMEIEKEGSFIIDQMEAFEVDWDGFDDEERSENGFKTLTRGERVAKTIRAVVESMLESHFGGDMMDDLFEEYGAIVGDYLSRNRTKYTNLVISFVKK